MKLNEIHEEILNKIIDKNITTKWTDDILLNALDNDYDLFLELRTLLSNGLHKENLLIIKDVGSIVRSKGYEEKIPKVGENFKIVDDYFLKVRLDEGTVIKGENIKGRIFKALKRYEQYNHIAFQIDGKIKKNCIDFYKIEVIR